MGNDIQRDILTNIGAEPNEDLDRFKDAISWPDPEESIFKTVPDELTGLAGSWIPIYVVGSIRLFRETFNIQFKTPDGLLNNSYKLTTMRSSILHDILNIGVVHRELGLTPRYVNPLDVDKHIITPTTLTGTLVAYMMINDTLILNQGKCVYEFNVHNTTMYGWQVQDDKLYYYELLIQPDALNTLSCNEVQIHVATVKNNPDRYFDRLMVIFISKTLVQ